ncbi:MAG: hypothetical protein ABSF50_06400 [Burkholderiaceae bacterium]
MKDSSRRTSPFALARICLVVGLLGCEALQAAETDVSGNAFFDSNVSNGAGGGAVRAAQGANAQLAVSDDLDLSKLVNATWNAYAETTVYNRYQGLNEVTLGGGAQFSHKFGLGRDVPVAIVDLDISHRSYSDSARDGWILRAAIGLAQRVEDALRLSGSVGVERRTQDNSPQYDEDLPGDVYASTAQFARLGVSLDLPAASQIALFVEQRRGDEAVTYFGDSEDYDEQARAIAPNPVFGPNAFVERIPVLTRGFSATYTYFAAPGWTVNASLRHDSSAETGGLRYIRNQAFVGASYAF